MKFSNLHRVKMQATSNYNDYRRAQSIYNVVSQKDKLYSNLEYAQGLITSMLEDNDIIPNDINHQILSKSIDNMTTIYSKSNLSSMDIDNFYTHYESIQDITNRLRGGEND